jgi:hypothetical protein
VTRRLKIISISGAALCLLGAFLNPPSFFVAYLFGYLFWLGIAVGALGLWMLHEVTGGAWGDVIKPLIQAAASTLPVMSLLFIPILFGLRSLYPWAVPGAAADAVLRHKAAYLNVPFFVLRSLLYLGLWSFMVIRLGGWARQAIAGDSAAAQRAARHSASGLVLFSLSVTFASIDWMMSLEPHWYSTVYPMLVIVGFLLSAFAFLVCALAGVRAPEQLQRDYPEKPFWDLGNMVLAFVMLWAYLHFSQYLVIFSANLPEEIVWYLHRQAGGWFWLALSLIVFQFFLPFLALLGRRNKQRLDRLRWIAASILAMHALELFWLIKPAFSPLGFRLHWLDLVAPAALGAGWLMLFRARLSALPSPVGVYIPEET